MFCVTYEKFFGTVGNSVPFESFEDAVWFFKKRMDEGYRCELKDLTEI